MKKPFPLVQVTVIRPGRKTKFASLVEALDKIKWWVWLGEAERLVEKDLGI
jgi:hypothetical protein